jgi:uncharacterized protein (DUF488 family)
MSRLFTIGFTNKSAARFFGLLREAGVREVIDIRLNNRSQLAGFSKSDDLGYFLRAISGIGYRHELSMAPTQEMLDAYKKQGGSWSNYERDFLELMSVRAVGNSITAQELDGACLLCSEHQPTYCHRRLVAEYLKTKLPSLSIAHLV